MTELEVKTFATSIGGDQHPSLITESILRPLTLTHIHRAVERDHRDTSGRQEFLQHRLGRRKLCEDQHLQVRFVFISLKLVYLLDQGFGLGIRARLLTFSGSIQQDLNMASLTLQGHHVGIQQLIKQLLPVHVVQLIEPLGEFRTVFKFFQVQTGLPFAFL